MKGKQQKKKSYKACMNIIDAQQLFLLLIGIILFMQILGMVANWKVLFLNHVSGVVAEDKTDTSREHSGKDHNILYGKIYYVEYEINGQLRAVTIKGWQDEFSVKGLKRGESVIVAYDPNEGITENATVVSKRFFRVQWMSTLLTFIAIPLAWVSWQLCKTMNHEVMPALRRMVGGNLYSGKNLYPQLRNVLMRGSQVAFAIAGMSVSIWLLIRYLIIFNTIIVDTIGALIVVYSVCSGIYLLIKLPEESAHRFKHNRLEQKLNSHKWSKKFKL